MTVAKKLTNIRYYTTLLLYSIAEILVCCFTELIPINLHV